MYTAITSLDGYVNDLDGNFDWAEPSDEVHAFVNDLERPIGTYLYGRRLYEVMVAWETMDLAGQPAVIGDYAQVWRAAEKIVYSKTLQATASARTRIERAFDLEAVREMKVHLARDINVGGPTLAASAIRAGLVDEYRFFVTPVLVGGGTPALPEHVHQKLELIDERRFDNGVVYLHHRAIGR
jgi:dihydrofolate reductase